MADDQKDPIVVGRFAADESDDNAIETSNTAYIGTDPMYQNAAYDFNSPSVSDVQPFKALEEAAREREDEIAALSDKLNVGGYTATTDESVFDPSKDPVQAKVDAASKSAKSAGAGGKTASTVPAD